MAKKTEYNIQGVPTKIAATSRCALCIRDKLTGKDNYYTIEALEERTFPSNSAVALNIDEEWKALFDSVNSVVDAQCEDIIQTFKKGR